MYLTALRNICSPSGYKSYKAAACPPVTPEGSRLPVRKTSRGPPSTSVGLPLEFSIVAPAGNSAITMPPTGPVSADTSAIVARTVPSSSMLLLLIEMPRDIVPSVGSGTAPSAYRLSITPSVSAIPAKIGWVGSVTASLTSPVVSTMVVPSVKPRRLERSV